MMVVAMRATASGIVIAYQVRRNLIVEIPHTASWV
jgi:hypothetical protein